MSVKKPKAAPTVTTDVKRTRPTRDEILERLQHHWTDLDSWQRRTLICSLLGHRMKLLTIALVIGRSWDELSGAYRMGGTPWRLQLINEIYNWCGTSVRGDNINRNREYCIARDCYQIVAAIAGDYHIQLSPHLKGVQTLRKNKALWERIEFFVKLKPRISLLPHDSYNRQEWEAIQPSAHDRAERLAIHFQLGGK